MTTSIEELLKRFQQESAAAREEVTNTSIRAVTLFATGDLENGINAGLDYIRTITKRESAEQSEIDGPSQVESGNPDGVAGHPTNDVSREGTAS